MLKTVKSRIIVITISILLILSFVACFLAFNFYTNSKRLKTEACDIMVAYFAEKVNKSIQQLQEDAHDLALMGEIFYNSNKSTKEFLDEITLKNFKDNFLSIGGGLWFEPYKIKQNQKRFCAYALWRGNNLNIDKSFENESYDYLTQKWYLEIKEAVDKGETTVWTTPYIDDTGSLSLMTTVGLAIRDKNNNFIGMSTVDWELNSIIQKLSSITPTDNSFVLFADKYNDFILALTKSNESDFVGKSLKTLPWYNPDIKNGQQFTYNKTKYISFIKHLDNNMILIVNVPMKELYEAPLKRLKVMLIFLFSTLFLISITLYKVLAYNINKPIDYLIKVSKEIGSGNLDVNIKLDEPQEFAELAQSFNRTTKDIKNYIENLSIMTSEKKRIESELDIAKSIQHSAMPNIFPPYPEKKEFDIYASMDTAREVGGDFYDFFFTDKDRFAFLVADVSGKGIPAALFMMNVKALIKNTAKTGLKPDKVMTQINKIICKNNKENFFVTVFMCEIELSSGKLTCVNAGHNPPLIKKQNGIFEYFKCKPDLPVGIMDDVIYQSSETMLDKDDYIFLYTDGLTEALNSELDLYGEKRLYNVLNNLKNLEVENILSSVQKDVDKFSQDTEKADDMTIMVFKYKEKANVQNVRSFLADISQMQEVFSWLNNLCEKIKLQEDFVNKINLVVEEIFVNIASYAYPDNKGSVEINLKTVDNKEIQLQFTDFGIPYNPLEKPDPDITLGADERQVGGLGIFMVKKLADFMDYKFEAGKNILTVKIKI